MKPLTKYQKKIVDDLNAVGYSSAFVSCDWDNDVLEIKKANKKKSKINLCFNRAGNKITDVCIGAETKTAWIPVEAPKKKKKKK